MATTDEFRESIGNIPPVFDRCILYQQYGGNISQVDDVDQFKVSGDATTLLSNGNTILFPLKAFTTEYIINTVAYNAGQDYSIITLTTSASLDSTDVGRTVCLKININEKLLKDGVGNVDQRIEGDQLTDYDSGSMRILVNNSDGYFHDKDGNGIFDSGDIFWFIYINGFRGDTDRVNYFGGLVDLVIKPNLYDKYVEFTVWGHSKELERYPAYRTVETDSDLMMMPNLIGVRIIRYTSSSVAEEGVKKIEYDPTAKSQLEGIRVISVSDDTKAGIKILEFRLPYWFRWNYGAWEKVTFNTVDANGNQTLHQKDGTGTRGAAVINFGDGNGLHEFPDYDTVAWVIIKNKQFEIPIIPETKYEQKDVVAQGKPTLRFDNGKSSSLYPYFPRLFLYDDSLTSFADISDVVNSQLEFVRPLTQIFDEIDDEVIFVSNDQFFGIEFYIPTPASGAVVFTTYFSTGFQSWQLMTFAANGLVDGTNGFEDGGQVRLTWTTAANWQPNKLYNDGVSEGNDYTRGYMIKIKRVSAAGTLPYLQFVKKLMLFRGANDDFIEIVVDNNRAPLVAKDDECVIWRDENGDLQVGTWYLLASMQFLLEDMLDKVNYDSTKRTLLDTKVTPTANKINVWGQCPKRDYSSQAHYFLKHTDGYAYVGTGTELYRIEIDGKMEFLCNFSVNVSTVASNTINVINIVDIWFDSPLIYCLMVQEYDPLRKTGEVHVVIGTYNLTTGDVTLISEENNGSQLCYPGFISTRMGYHWSQVVDYYNLLGQHITGTQYYTALGQKSGESDADHGENLSLPFRQVLSGTVLELNQNALVPATSMASTPVGADRFQVWYFWQTPSPGGAYTVDNLGPYYNALEGFYALPDRLGEDADVYPDMYLKWKSGQQGLIIVDKTNHDVYVIKWIGFPYYQLLIHNLYFS